MKAPADVRILFVCLGNICRSPTAEGVLRHLLKQEAPALRIEVDSAGTADYHIGDPPDVRTQRAAMRRGIDLSDLRARQVVPQDFARFDWILAMDRNNLRDLRSMQPKVTRARLGLFLEFGEKSDGPLDAGALDVPDPYYGNSGDFERVLDLTTAASRGLIDALRRT